jgi:hypothetical protein
MVPREPESAAAKGQPSEVLVSNLLTIGVCREVPGIFPSLDYADEEWLCR